MLPTEERFTKLTDLQKQLLFVGYLEHPTSEQLHAANWSADTDQVTDEDEEHFKDLGYTQEQIDRMKEQLEAAGLV